MFEILHKSTIDRGNYAFSAIVHNNERKKIYVLKQEDHPQNIDTELIFKERNLYDELKGITLYMGHNQAPTSAARTYNITTSHPFSAGHWYVAHNGVLTNYKQINKDYCPQNKNVVDTACIPWLLKYIETRSNAPETEAEIVTEALSMLEGTFALWIFNGSTGSVYIARQGSTLFFNYETGDFCSIKSTNPDAKWEEVPEGKLFLRIKEAPFFLEAGTFESTSPFLTI